MNNDTDHFDKTIKAAAEKRRAQDFDDLQNEMAGVDVGRISRFLSPEARALLLEKRTGKRSGAISALDMMLLNDPIYAHAYNGTMSTLERAETVAERHLHKQEAQLIKAETELKDTLNTASTLPDGRKAFKDIHGQVRDKHGKFIDELTTDKIEWRGSEPNYESYLTKKKSVQELKDSIHEIRVYQTDVLGKVREDLTDHNDPQSLETIKSMKQRIEEQAPELFRSEIQLEPITQEEERTSTYSISKPEF